ncbi:MAG: DinB family protein [Ginsengibacter sp.]
MQSIALELESIIDQHITALKAIPESKMIYKPAPSKWSKKEILGHIVDSAQNNIRRFIVAQYDENPTIAYNQDKWVAIANYQHYDVSNLINLWYLLNKHLGFILKNTSQEMAQRKCQTEDLHTLEWLAQDYIKHLRHHLHQVLELEPIAYP